MVGAHAKDNMTKVENAIQMYALVRILYQIWSLSFSIPHNWINPGLHRNKHMNTYLQHISECCDKVEVVQSNKDSTGAHDNWSSYFTIYTIEHDLINGKVHYTSNDKTKAISCGPAGDWNMNTAAER